MSPWQPNKVSFFGQKVYSYKTVSYSIHMSIKSRNISTLILYSSNFSIKILWKIYVAMATRVLQPEQNTYNQVSYVITKSSSFIDIWLKIDFSKIIAFVSPATIQNHQSMGAHDPGF